MNLSGDWAEVVDHINTANGDPMKNPIKAEPVGIAAAVQAVLNALVLLGVVDLTVDQITGVNIALVAVLGLFVRSQVQPTP